MTALNTNEIPDYYKHAKMVLLTKTNSPEATIEDTIPIMVFSQLTKIFKKKTIKLKTEELKSDLL